MADVNMALKQAQATYEQAQQSYEKFNQKYREAKQAVLSAQSTFAGVQTIGDRTTIETSSQLLKNVQNNLDRISANLLVAKENVKAARNNLENAKKAVELEEKNHQPLKQPLYTTISTSYGDIKITKKNKPKPSQKRAAKEQKDAPVKMTRAEYRQKLNEHK
ncbi:hypothetical protein GIX77_09935 [Lactobacillus reuteri]|uniref:Uncharacterized protein n=1 Tax=Limosilactobacillus reuteri TaxID=1598 RepID=A0A7X2G5Z3_LIMRT|nr:hypothetical protein [Limosilactobacillus reuteri]MCC4358781.1 hypothetical protein [Limosilactobacillus reuteri]MCC4363007.1 hypothetical protein [Limosilactobacillus reuteri]MCC4364808.1 hypothetical protein [Limosilactobacillus reuteri]MRH72928.1 hypothetical protein [Limosilactobacillus reuteri]MRH81076.1 hypothetical protein [Limosilactobacillus reuteri]